MYLFNGPDFLEKSAQLFENIKGVVGRVVENIELNDMISMKKFVKFWLLDAKRIVTFCREIYEIRNSLNSLSNLLNYF